MGIGSGAPAVSCKEGGELRGLKLEQQAPAARLQRLRQELHQKRLLLQALSPERWLQRGLALVNNASGTAITGINDVRPGDRLTVQLRDGLLDTRVDAIRPASDASSP